MKSLFAFGWQAGVISVYVYYLRHLNYFITVISYVLWVINVVLWFIRRVSSYTICIFLRDQGILYLICFLFICVYIILSRGYRHFTVLGIGISWYWLYTMYLTIYVYYTTLYVMLTDYHFCIYYKGDLCSIIFPLHWIYAFHGVLGTGISWYWF